MFDKTATEVEKIEIVASTKINSTYFGKLSNKINQSNIKLFTNTSENITIAIFRFLDDPNKLFGVKGYFLNGKFNFMKEILVGKKLQSVSNGEAVILNGHEGLIIKSVNGIDEISPINEEQGRLKIIQVDDCLGNHGGTGFCQREAGESFSSCYKAEKDEFCDGFFSCIAVDTQVPVMLLIAGACSCSASECKK